MTIWPTRSSGPSNRSPAGRAERADACNHEQACPRADAGYAAVLGRLRPRRTPAPALPRLRQALLLSQAGLPGLRFYQRGVVCRQRPGHPVLLRHQPPARARLRERRPVRDCRRTARRGTADDDEHHRRPEHPGGPHPRHGTAGDLRAARGDQPPGLRTRRKRVHEHETMDRASSSPERRRPTRSGNCRASQRSSCTWRPR